ncbi:MAG: DUF1517 domain-containing protein [Cyanobacteriota bacterium]|nr:DUF1517 domain-containing protein [Cyanobacteriota bacterium]
MVVPILLATLLLAAPHPADAAAGGRIGGGSFRSSPSPRSYGGGASRYRGSGGMGGRYVPAPYGGGYNQGGYGYRGGYGFGGGGIGLPFLVPMFGFGGGLFGLLLLMAVVGLVVNAIRGATSVSDGADMDGDPTRAQPSGPITLAQVQVGLLPAAKQLQADLRRLATTADTNSSAGLRLVLQETSLSLLRNPELWVYANVESGQVSFAAAEDTFNRLSMQERSKLSKEVLTNVVGRRNLTPSMLPADQEAPDAPASDFIAVTLLVASRAGLPLKQDNTPDALRDALQQLGAISESDLIALEVIWQPEGVGEVLTTDELLTAYPQLQHL